MRRWVLLTWVFLLVPASVGAQPRLGKLWLESQLGDPERGVQTGRGMTELPVAAYRFDGGVYESIASRIALSLPVFRDEAVVSVRESIIARRPDGSFITTHVLFVPGPVGLGLLTDEGVSAVVVTRLRDDRPKDRESVLRQFEPPNEQARAAMAQRGVEYDRVGTNMGQAVQRVVRNRAANEPFPYRMQLSTDQALRSIGASRYVIAEGDSLIEFSQVYPCAQQSETDCRSNAVSALDRFMAGVKHFLTLPTNSKQ